MEILKKIDRNLIEYLLGVSVLFFLFVFLVTCTQIGYGVRTRCDAAEGRYGGECVDALMAQVADESTDYGKNNAIWALGQLGDKRALPFLEQYVADEEIPDHESWNEDISQYELKKAIGFLENGYNISAFM
ncbi:MAG: hypothetical protein PHI66_01780 [Candidatus Pacebacteria bacterium]|nr:hypothetical protein [Candidatus Paceibacterota bacterium]